MKRSANYKTKQQDAILNYIKALGEEHITAAQLAERMRKESFNVSRTTIYRHLEKLYENGLIRKYTVDGMSGACFQYTGANEDCGEQFHLKCEGCGELLHLKCDVLAEVKEHILKEHVFKLNTLKTVLYGKCENCL